MKENAMPNLAPYQPDSSEEVPLRGLDRAVERYGTPSLQRLTLEVTPDTLAYWRRVRERRVAEVIMLLRRKNGGYLVHTKAFYPKGVYRLISGGIKPDEDLVEAVHRETQEETSLQVGIDRFLAVFQYRFRRASESQGFTSYLFHVSELEGYLEVGDPTEAITGFRDISLSGLESVAQDLENLAPDWVDWGRFRAAPHRYAFEMLVGSHLEPGEDS